MGFLEQALQSRPEAAASPLSFIIYLVALATRRWTSAGIRPLKLLLDRIEHVPEEERRGALQAAMGVVLPETVDPEQWLRARKQVYWFLSSLALCFLVLSLA